MFLPARPLAAAVVAAALAIAAAAPADASARVFGNCTDLHRVYAGGVARPGVTGNRVGSSLRPFTGHVTFSAALYAANRARDRDGDGIACELG